MFNLLINEINTCKVKAPPVNQRMKAKKNNNIGHHGFLQNKIEVIPDLHFSEQTWF